MTTALQEKKLADARAAEAANAAAAEARAAKALAKSHSAQSLRILELNESKKAVEEHQARAQALPTIATHNAVAEAKRTHEMKQRKVDASLRRTKVHKLVLKKTHRKARHAKAKAVLARASAQAAEAASVCSRKAQEARERREHASEEAQVSLEALKVAESAACKAKLEGEEARANFKRARERFGPSVFKTPEEKRFAQRYIDAARMQQERKLAHVAEANRLARAARVDATWSKSEADKREAEEAKAQAEAAAAKATAQRKAHLSAMVDGDGDGKLDATELLELVKTLDGFDDDGDGQIDEEILARFRVLADADGDGCVRVDEVLRLIDADDDGNVDDTRSLAERCEIEAREQRCFLASSVAACVESAEKKSADSTAKARAAAARHREAALRAAEMSDAAAAAEAAVVQAQAEGKAAEAKAKEALAYRLQAEQHNAVALRFEKERAEAREAARVAMAEAERRRVLSTRVDSNGDGELDETEVCALLEMFGIVDANALHGQRDAKALANRLLMMLGLESINNGGRVGVAEMLALIDADGDGKVDEELGSRLSLSHNKSVSAPELEEAGEEAISNVKGHTQSTGTADGLRNKVVELQVWHNELLESEGQENKKKKKKPQQQESTTVQERGTTMSRSGKDTPDTPDANVVKELRAKVSKLQEGIRARDHKLRVFARAMHNESTKAKSAQASLARAKMVIANQLNKAKAECKSLQSEAAVHQTNEQVWAAKMKKLIEEHSKAMAKLREEKRDLVKNEHDRRRMVAVAQTHALCRDQYLSLRRRREKKAAEEMKQMMTSSSSSRGARLPGTGAEDVDGASPHPTNLPAWLGNLGVVGFQADWMRDWERMARDPWIDKLGDAAVESAAEELAVGQAARWKVDENANGSQL